MKKILLILVIFTMYSCDTTCVEETRVNGKVYSTFEYSIDEYGDCYCTESSYTVGGDRWTTECYTK